jgi:hypothetical protein
VCRRSGLETKRRCGWKGFEEDDRAPLVWARRGAAARTCPTSFVTAESLGLVEEFSVRKRLGLWDMAGLTARQVEAFVILEKELAAEGNDGQRNARQAV